MTTQAQFERETARTGEFVRQPNRFTDRITRDSASKPGEGPDEHGRWPVEAGRYRLVVSLACPWAHRSVIVRRLLGLEDAISLAVVDPIRDERGWRFWLDDGHRDPVLGIEYLSEAYLRTRPGVRPAASPCRRSSTPSPAGWSRTTTRRSPSTCRPSGRSTTGPAPPSCYPRRERAEMDDLMDAVYRDVNNGVYRCGFATSQEAYEAAYDALFARLDELERAAGGPAVPDGRTLREVDIRLFTTLVRFDAVYHGHFKCNRSKLTELPVLWALRPRPVPDAGLRRDGRLRPHQAALLRARTRDQPDADRARRGRTCRAGRRRTAASASARPRGRAGEGRVFLDRRGGEGRGEAAARGGARAETRSGGVEALLEGGGDLGDTLALVDGGVERGLVGPVALAGDERRAVGVAVGELHGSVYPGATTTPPKWCTVVYSASRVDSCPPCIVELDVKPE